MSESKVGSCSPAVDGITPLFTPNPQDSVYNPFIHLPTQRQRNMTTRRCLSERRIIYICLVIIFVLTVLVTFQTLKLSLRVSRSDCVYEEYNMTGLVCLTCEQNGVPGVKTVFRTANDLCCVEHEEYKAIQDKIIPQHPADKRRNRDNNKRQRRKSVSAHLNLKLTDPDHLHDGTLVWKNKQFDGVTFLRGQINVTDEGVVQVRWPGVYEITVHVCLDAVNNEMEVEKWNIILGIVKTSPVSYMEAHQDRTTLQRGTYSSQSLTMNLLLRQNEGFRVTLSTFKYLYQMEVCNTLDITFMDE